MNLAEIRFPGVSRGHLISGISGSACRYPVRPPEVESRRTPWNHPAPFASEPLTHALSTLSKQIAPALAADPAAAVALREILEHVHAELRDCMLQSP